MNNDPVLGMVRASDPDTSRLAAHRALPRMNEVRARVLAAIRDMERATDEEIQAYACDRAWNETPSGLRTRRSELVRMGLVKDSGYRKTLATGRMGTVWCAHEARR